MHATLASLVFFLSLASLASARTYATRFPSAENPVSEGGAWLNGAKDGLDWGDVSTTAGQTHPHPGPARYADATALLSGSWGPDQSAQGVVWAGNPSNYPEVEIRLRSTLSAHRCDGYEITFSIAPNAYMLIVRWNGPLGDYTILSNPQGAQYQVKAAVVGKVISAYKNGVLMGQATDGVYASGLPGMEFNEQQNGDYGYAGFSATDGLATSIQPMARPRRRPFWVTEMLPKMGIKICDLSGRELVAVPKNETFFQPKAVRRSDEKLREGN